MNRKPDDTASEHQNYYQTGRTQPPKNRRGPVCCILMLLIFLGGILNALDLHLPLFEQQGRAEITPLSFSPTDAPVFSDKETLPADSRPILQIAQTPQSRPNVPQSGGLSLQEIYAANIHSVVSVSCQSKTAVSSGTGVIFSEDGFIVTNCHVIAGANTISVQLTDQRVLSARVVGMDAVSDLAVLQVDATDLIPAVFGDSSALQVGDLVVAIGDPLGVELRGTMTDGIVSAINRDITVGGRTMTLIQTNAALNAGNSGGPLLNCYGQIVGINTMKMQNGLSGAEGLGFAIPSTTVKEVVDQLLTQGYVSGRPTLGLSGQAISSLEQVYYRIPKGLWITEVDPDSDAAAHGIRPGDVLLRINNRPISDAAGLQSAVLSTAVGELAEVVIYRSGRQITVQILVGEATE